jgi:hypothetical protein
MMREAGLSGRLAPPGRGREELARIAATYRAWRGEPELAHYADVRGIV